MPPHDRLAREADHYSLIGIQLDIARIVQEIIRSGKEGGSSLSDRRQSAASSRGHRSESIQRQQGALGAGPNARLNRQSNRRPDRNHRLIEVNADGTR